MNWATFPTLTGFAVAIRGATSPADLAASLRAAAIPVIARIEGDRVLLDAKTLLPGDEDAIEQALRAAPGVD